MSKYEFTFPDVGEGLDKGVVLAWRAAQGERVKADQIIAEVETDKAIVEIPSPVSGIVVRLGVAAGQSISVGGSPRGIRHQRKRVQLRRASTEPEPAGGNIPVRDGRAKSQSPGARGSLSGRTSKGKPRDKEISTFVGRRSHRGQRNRWSWSGDSGGRGAHIDQWQDGASSPTAGACRGDSPDAARCHGITS